MSEDRNAHYYAANRLMGTQEFKVILAFLRSRRQTALNDLLGAPVDDLADRRGYARALDDVLKELEKSPDVVQKLDNKVR